MTEASQGEVGVKTVDPTETATDEKEKEKSSLKASRPEHLEVEGVQHPLELENGSENSTALESDPAGQPSETLIPAVDSQVSEPVNNGEVSLSEKKSDEDGRPAQTSEATPVGTEEQRETDIKSPLEKEPDNDSPLSSHIDQQTTKAIDSSKADASGAEASVKEISAENVSGEPNTSVESPPVGVADQVDSAQEASSQKPETSTFDEVSIIPESMETSDKVSSDKGIHENQPYPSAQKDPHADAETGDEINDDELVAGPANEDKDEPGSKAEPLPDVQDTDTSALEDKGTSADESVAESAEPRGTDEQIKSEETRTDPTPVNEDPVERTSQDVTVEETVLSPAEFHEAEVKNEIKADQEENLPSPNMGEVQKGSSSKEANTDTFKDPDSVAPEVGKPKHSVGLLESVGDQVLSIGASVFPSAKVDQEENAASPDTGEVQKSSSSEEANVGTVKDQESSGPEEEPKHSSGLLESVGDTVLSSVFPSAKVDQEETAVSPDTGEVQKSSLTEEENVETVKDQESSTPEEEPKHSSGLLESVGDRVLSIGASVFPSSKVDQEETAASPETGEVQKSSLTEEENVESVKDQESSAPEEEPKHSSGLLESVGDRVLSIGASVFPSAKADQEETAASPDTGEVQKSSLTEEENVESVKNQESSVPEEEPKHSSGLLESVGDRVLSIGASVFPSAKADQEDTAASPDTGDVQKSSLTEEANVEPVKNQQSSGPEEEPKHSSGLLESVGDRVLSFGANVVQSAKGIVGLETSGPDTETGNEIPEDSTVPESVSKTETAEVRQEVPEEADESGQRAFAPAEMDKEVKDDGQVLDGVNGVLPSQTVGTEGAVEKNFNVVVPEKKPAEETLSIPTTPRTPGGTPLIKRVEQLEKKLAEFEDKQYSPHTHTGSTGPSTPRSSLDRYSRSVRETLEETLSKGSLLERVATLERKLDHVSPVAGEEAVSRSTSVTNEEPTTSQTEQADISVKEPPAADQAEPSSIAVKDEEPAAHEPERTSTSLLEEEKPESTEAAKEPTKAPSKPQKVQFEEPKDEAQSRSFAETLESARPEAAENLLQVTSPAELQEKLGTEENVAKTAEDSPAKGIAGGKDVAVLEESATQSSAQDVKVPEDSKTTAEKLAQGPVETREPHAAVDKMLQGKKRKTGGPISKFKARFKGCFSSGAHKGSAV